MSCKILDTLQWQSPLHPDLFLPLSLSLTRCLSPSSDPDWLIFYCFFLSSEIRFQSEYNATSQVLDFYLYFLLVLSGSAFAADHDQKINIKFKGRWGPGHSLQRDQQRHDHHGGRQRQPQLRGQVSQSIIHNQSELKTQKIHIKIRFLEATLSRPSRGRGRTSSPSSSATRGARAAPWKVRREGDKHVKCDVVHAACRYYPSSEKSWTLSRWWQVTSDFVLEVVPGAELELISILFDYFLTRYQPQQWHAA